MIPFSSQRNKRAEGRLTDQSCFENLQEDKCLWARSLSTDPTFPKTVIVFENAGSVFVKRSLAKLVWNRDYVKNVDENVQQTFLPKLRLRQTNVLRKHQQMVDYCVRAGHENVGLRGPL